MSEDTLFGIKPMSFEDAKSIDISKIDLMQALYNMREKLKQEIEHLHPDIQKMYLDTHDQLFPGVKDYKPEAK